MADGINDLSLGTMYDVEDKVEEALTKLSVCKRLV